MHVALRIAGALVLAVTLAILLVAPTAAQRDPVDRDAPEMAAALTPPYCLGVHDVGQLVVGVNNYARVGIGRGKGSRTDCFTGRPAPKGEYPKGSKSVYLYEGGLWVGGIIGLDTLVSAGTEYATIAMTGQSREFHPTTPLIKYSGLDYTSADYELARSEQDYVAVFADTFTNVGFGSFDPVAYRPHKPMGLKVEQRSYAWSYGHTDDFIIVTYRITNIGKKKISDAWVGMYWDGDVHISGTDITSVQPLTGKPPTGGRDDLSGFLWDAQSPFEQCESLDTIGLAWTIDNDGDFKNGELQVPHIGGIRMLGPEMTDPNYTLSYNWWVYNYNQAYDFGPQRRDRYRDLGNGPGTPYGDRNKYYLMSNGEIDYDQMYTLNIRRGDQTWMFPGTRVPRQMSMGADVNQLLTIGPRDLNPGAVIDFAIAFVAGEDFHIDPSNFSYNLSGNYNPDQYLANCDFSEIIRNSITASRVYDIPGFDTNDDGYLGKFRVCVFDSALVDGEWVPTVADTSYYEGDGVPDFRAAAPPPPPDLWLHPSRNGLRVRFNGVRSETARDIFSGDLDFEGYRVYLARDNRDESFSLYAQYDRKNFEKWVYTDRVGKEDGFVRMGNPLTLEEVRCLYGDPADPCGDSTFDPLRFSATHPYFHPLFPDSVFYFSAHDYNRSEFGVSTTIRKIYPDQEPPASILEPLPEDLTEEGRLKYYEYEVEITGLLAAVPYYIAVTAFDHGSPQAGMAPLESSRTINSRSAYPNNAWDEKADSLTNIYVYPNPYRHDAYYRVAGLEGRGQDDRSRDRVRKITFANLPPTCTIRVFSLDGDLVREMEHDMDPADPNAPYHEWDMISRNYQMIVSGLYYWVVETPDGRTQIGKLAVLM